MITLQWPVATMWLPLAPLRPIIGGVPRRLHVSKLFVGQVPLDPVQARHAREVLRLKEGDRVELFDSAGQEACGVLRFIGPKDAAAVVDSVSELPRPAGVRLTVASAVPKGERADWMVEKLSELGVAAFIPLATDRSVVKPEGKNKLQRWQRIATESAKQSRRTGVMRIEELRPLRDVLDGTNDGVYLSTEPGVEAIPEVLSGFEGSRELTLFVGPEGGWTAGEMDLFRASKARSARLTATILRIETAAVAGAAMVLCMGRFSQPA